MTVERGRACVQQPLPARGFQPRFLDKDETARDNPWKQGQVRPSKAENPMPSAASTSSPSGEMEVASMAQ